jgi:hypothetical protein
MVAAKPQAEDFSRALLILIHKLKILAATYKCSACGLKSTRK